MKTGNISLIVTGGYERLFRANPDAELYIINLCFLIT